MLHAMRLDIRLAIVTCMLDAMLHAAQIVGHVLLLLVGSNLDLDHMTMNDTEFFPTSIIFAIPLQNHRRE
jgi:hypothetical protein